MSPKSLPYNPLHRLTADLRGVPFQRGENHYPTLPIPLSEAIQRYFQHHEPCSSRQKTLTFLREYWNSWFEGTAFIQCYPQKLDRSDVLWLKTSDTILRQQLQFRLKTLESTLQQFLPEKIKKIRLV